MIVTDASLSKKVARGCFNTTTTKKETRPKIFSRDEYPKHKYAYCLGSIRISQLDKI